MIGGAFTSVGGQTRSRVARLNADGTLDTTFVGPEIDGTVFSVALQPDGKVVVGGLFSSVGGQTRDRVARFNADGSLDTSFGDPDVDGTVFSVALQPDGKVLIGGEFTSAGGQARKNVARLNSNGTLDATFVDRDISAFVRSVALQPDGKVLIGGDFTSVGGESRRRVARLNADGSLDTSFGDPNAFGGPVNSVALQPDGKVLIGGGFITVGDQNQNAVARLNANGSLDNTFVTPQVLNNGVDSVALQPDGKVLIGGDFTSVGGESRRRVARLNANGSLDTSFVNPNVNDRVFSVALQPDGNVLIGGAFASVGGETRNRVARLDGDPSPPVNLVPPATSGTPKVGQTLSASPGTWLGTPTPTYDYQWQRC